MTDPAWEVCVDIELGIAVVVRAPNEAAAADLACKEVDADYPDARTIDPVQIRKVEEAP